MVSEKKKKFNDILKKIKEIKIQGATNVAKAALKAYSLVPGKESVERLLTSRPTEPMMKKVLDMADYFPKEEILRHFSQTQDRINRHSLRLIKNKDIIFTHCHSTNVSKALIYSHKKGRKFQVYITETRPLYQGRLTAREMEKAGIKVTIFVDSGFTMAIGKDSKKDKIYATKTFIGADALLKEGIINKIGSKTAAEISYLHKIPFYVFTDSWKFTKNKIPIEQRALNEIWDKAPKGIKIKNPAFEFVPKKYITGIVTEFGIMKYEMFVKKCLKRR